jgi:hypothetical protein
MKVPQLLIRAEKCLCAITLKKTLTICAISFLLASCSKKDEPTPSLDHVSGDYLCHDTLFHHRLTSNCPPAVWLLTAYDSVYMVHIEYKKDSNLVIFEDVSYSLDSNLSCSAYDYSAGGYQSMQLKIRPDSLYFMEDRDHVYLQTKYVRRLAGKRIPG